MAGFTLKIGADASAYKNELEKMRTQTKGFSSKIGGLMKGAFGLLSVGMLRNISKEFVEMGLAADRLNVDTSQFTQMAQAAAAFQIPVDNLADAMKDLNVKITEAVLDPKGSYGQLFKEMGFDAVAAETKGPVEQMYRFVDALSKVPQQRVGHFMDEFGDSMYNLGRFARQTRPELEAMVNQFKGFSKNEIDSLVEGEAAWNRITLQLKMQLLPVLTTIAGTISGITMFLDNPRKFMEERNRRANLPGSKVSEDLRLLSGGSGTMAQKMRANAASVARTNMVAEANRKQIPLVVFPTEAVKSLQAIEENTKDKAKNQTNGEL